MLNSKHSVIILMRSIFMYRSIHQLGDAINRMNKCPGVWPYQKLKRANADASSETQKIVAESIMPV
jgi:hypothetical protein